MILLASLISTRQNSRTMKKLMVHEDITESLVCQGTKNILKDLQSNF